MVIFMVTKTVLNSSRFLLNACRHSSVIYFTRRLGLVNQRTRILGPEILVGFTFVVTSGWFERRQGRTDHARTDQQRKWG